MTDLLIRLAVTVVPLAGFSAWWVWKTSREQRARIAALEADSAAYWEQYERKSAEWEAESRRLDEEYQAIVRRVEARFDAGSPSTDGPSH